MHYMHTARTWVLILSILFGFSSFGLLIHLVILARGGQLFVNLFSSEFEIVGLLAGALGVLLWPVMLVLPIFRRDVLFLNVIFELTIMVVFCILWATAGILILQWRQNFLIFDSCDDFGPPQFTLYCRESLAVQWMTVALFAIAALYLISLLIFAAVSHRRGRPVWKSCITDLGSDNRHTPQFTMGTYSESDTQVGIPSYSNDPIYSTKSPNSLHLNLPPHFAMRSFYDSESQVGSSPYLKQPMPMTTTTNSTTSLPTPLSAGVPTASLHPQTPNFPQL